MFENLKQYVIQDKTILDCLNQALSRKSKLNHSQSIGIESILEEIENCYIFIFKKRVAFWFVRRFFETGVHVNIEKFDQELDISEKLSGWLESLKFYLVGFNCFVLLKVPNRCRHCLQLIIMKIASLALY